MDELFSYEIHIGEAIKKKYESLYKDVYVDSRKILGRYFPAKCSVCAWVGSSEEAVNYKDGDYCCCKVCGGKLDYRS